MSSASTPFIVPGRAHTRPPLFCTVSAPSGMSSIYSQPLTRRSTATDRSSLLPTPSDDLSLRGPGPKPASAITAQDAIRIYSPSDATPLDQHSASQIRRNKPLGLEDGPLPVDHDQGSYFARPSRTIIGGLQLNRRGTTKELIGRFEALGDSPKSSAEGTRVRPGRPPSLRRDASVPKKDKDKDKGRSPIRQSFRNLLSVFKKSKPSTKEQQAFPYEAPAKCASSEVDVGGTPTPSRRPHRLTLQIPGSDVPTMKDPIMCVSPVSAHTGKAGPLLYLAPRLTPKIPPVWMDCIAQLHSTHILVMWDTPQGNPSPTLVSFTACTDVRSLAATDLDVDEQSMLPSDPEWKVFELLFEGRARERFAAKSLTDRATWVSAIWDAVLLAQENKVRSPAATEAFSTLSVMASSTRHPIAPPSSDNAEPGSPVTTTTRISHIATGHSADHDLPPIPDQATEGSTHPQMDQRNLSASALSTLPAPPLTPTSIRSSFLSPTRSNSPSRAQSPSIRNLDQRSVVKQRLAQMERASTADSASPIVTPREGILPPMCREGSMTSSGPASILNSYMGPDPISPVSIRSTGLTTLASRFGTPSHSTRVGTNHDDTDALFSPTSRYSAEDDQKDNCAQKARMSAFNRPIVSTFSPVLTSSVAQLLEGADVAIADSNSTETKPVLEDIRRGADVLQGRSVTDSSNIVAIRIKVDELLGELRRVPQGDTGDVAPEITGKLEQLQIDVKSQLADLQAAVNGLRDCRTPEFAGLTALHEKLDGLVQLSQRTKTGDNCPGGNAPGATVGSNEIGEVLSLLKDAEEERATQMEQQTDSIRYLNELNTWLEAFVKHGTSQIEGVAAGVQRLCREFGSVLELQDPAEQGGEGEAGTEVPTGNSGSLLGDIRRLLVQNQEREQNAEGLHASVNGLMAAVQEDLRRNAEARNLLTTESVIGMIDRQRQDQERMLKALATELSNDIRGERLRFVEAMKEATAINVQIHVEEFKKELTREVLLMTQEVTRLERERQGLEQQIADLFAFYAKQKNAVKGGTGRVSVPVHGQGQRTGQPTLAIFPGALAPSQSIPRRPLPSPVPSPTRMRA